MNILWHMPILNRNTCGLSNRAIRDAQALQSFGHRLTIAVARDKTDFETDVVCGMTLLKLDLRRTRPLHWCLQAVARRHSAAHAVRMMGREHDVFISCQPAVVAAYRRRHQHRPLVFVCGGSTLLHDNADAAQYAGLHWTRQAPFIIDRRLKHANERAAFLAADFVAFNSHFMRRKAVQTFGLRPSKCHTVYAGLDENHFRPPTRDERAAARKRLALNENDLVLCWTGRFAPEKNLELLINALPRCHPPVDCLLLVGDGPLVGAIKAHARRLSVFRRVRFCGPQFDVRPYIHASDIFAFPSRSESFGISLVEAMGCGLPCIALAARSDQVQNASAEILAGGTCGLIVTADEPAAFARAIDSLAQNPAYRAGLGRMAAAHARANFTWSAAGRRLNELIIRLPHFTSRVSDGTGSAGAFPLRSKGLSRVSPAGTEQASVLSSEPSRTNRKPCCRDEGSRDGQFPDAVAYKQWRARHSPQKRRGTHESADVSRNADLLIAKEA